MKLKYLVPVIGVYWVWCDIPHLEHERASKPLQGNDAVFVTTVSWMSTLLFLVTVLIASL